MPFASRGAGAALTTAVLAAALVAVPFVGAPPAAAQDSTTPVVAVGADHAKVWEGDTATFTVTATPAPASDLTVAYNVDDTYDATAMGAGPHQVTVKAGESTAKISVRTKDMVVRFPRGLFTGSLPPDEGGDGYVYCTKQDVLGMTSQSKNSNHEKKFCYFKTTTHFVGDVEVVLAASTSQSYTLAGSKRRASTDVGHVDLKPSQPTVSFASATATVDEGVGTHTVTLSASSAPTQDVALSYALSGTASRGSDYSIAGVTSNSGTVVLRSGETSASIGITVIDDNVPDSGETLILTLGGGTGYAVGSQSTHTLTITNDEPAVNPSGNNRQSSSTATTPRRSSAYVPITPPIARLRLGEAAPSVLRAGESAEMTVTLARRVKNFVRVFIEIDSDAALNDDYAVDVKIDEDDENGRWTSLGANPRRLVFDLPPSDTAAMVRVRSLRSSAGSTSVTVSIGDRTFAAGSVARIVPEGGAGIELVGTPQEDSPGQADAAVPDDSDDAPQEDSPGQVRAEESDGAHQALASNSPQDAAQACTSPGGFSLAYTVRRGDTLRAIARAFYGDGAQWKQIFDANRGCRQNDGHVFDGPDAIRAGWTVRIPGPIAAPSVAAAAHAPYAAYCVERGDTLRAVARRIYGDAALYDRIVMANRGQRQPDGRTFIHGDDIRPGWQLRIPLAAS